MTASGGRATSKRKIKIKKRIKIKIKMKIRILTLSGLCHGGCGTINTKG